MICFESLAMKIAINYFLNSYQGFDSWKEQIKKRTSILLIATSQFTLHNKFIDYLVKRFHFNDWRALQHLIWIQTGEIKSFLNSKNIMKIARDIFMLLSYSGFFNGVYTEPLILLALYTFDACLPKSRADR